MIYLISINYKWLLNVDLAFCESYTCYTIGLTFLLSTPMGIEYVVFGFDMEVQPLVTHNAARPLCVSAICIDHLHNAKSTVGIDVVRVHKLLAYRVVSTVSTDIMSSHTKYCRIA